ncbi:MAG TPA: UDP-N-acetylglucosamine--N-acetylmuramyl-(pentapeptide) pyrophosphoryl-undecaprenol N-acetylglucosamine transferase [Rariglobus sp.]|jgi:UDP-N-acetylglucosamine--N-acetylmuramyl-(pentapeptide) pyrophosphoryl-undecaprenol N-acetylglucosamine transferase|nr:UDP-N-acetylglucosamine--N-acetylmuramyl-(pentapeptide) pyrophosphoryl-undecaprenol N-acetylglucosamine transferase [Rariglobus sp.]
MSDYIISCGGTGGHLSPGIALAEGLAARGHSATLLISHKRVDARLVEKYPTLRFERIPGSPFTLEPAGFLRFVVSQTRGFLFSLKLVRSLRPAGIVGFGGFTTAAIIVAGKLCGVPVALHEANRVPGRAIRLLGRLSKRVYLPPGVTIPGLKQAKVRHVGLPVRKEIVRLSQPEARQRLGLEPARKVLAIFGGSQGATVLNEWARREMPLLAAGGVQLYCVTGLGKGAPDVLTLKSQQGASVKAVFVPFSDQVAELLSAADLVVARAGAGSIAELIRCGTPSVVVPYPHAADNHQQANAVYFAQEGGSLVVPQTDLTGLSRTVIDLLFDDARLQKLRTDLERMGRENPLDLILADLEILTSRDTAIQKKEPTAA